MGILKRFSLSHGKPYKTNKINKQERSLGGKQKYVRDDLEK